MVHVNDVVLMHIMIHFMMFSWSSQASVLRPILISLKGDEITEIIMNFDAKHADSSELKHLSIIHTIVTSCS